jgi:hypothetical protein
MVDGHSRRDGYMGNPDQNAGIRHRREYDRGIAHHPHIHRLWHGFDIAGLGTADYSSLEAACSLALLLARNKMRKREDLGIFRNSREANESDTGVYGNTVCGMILFAKGKK